MYNSLSYKTKQFFSLIIKLSIVIGCGYFIYLRLMENEQLKFSVFYLNLIENNVFTLKNCSILIIFTTFNWFFEISKWHLLISFINKYSFKKALIQSLASLTTSLITPNRIGEYGAKALCFETKQRNQVLGLNLVGNFYQLLMTFIFGIIGFSYFIYQHKIGIDFYQIFKVILLCFSVITVFFFITKYFNHSNSFFEKARTFTKKISLRLNLKVCLFSFLRFVTFSHQFYFLLLIFKIDISYFNALSAITSVYLIASVVPMLSMFDFVLKGTVAIWIFSFYNVQPIIILSITSIMWLLNFVLPAIIGSYFVLTFKPNFVK